MLEPLQTADSVEGQIKELALLLEGNADLPVIMVGFSWGAILAHLLAAQRPELVAKLVLVSNPPLEERYADSIMGKRLERLDEDGREEYFSLVEALEDPSVDNKCELFYDMGKLLAAADSYNSIEADDEVLGYQYEIYRKVWTEAVELRREGLLGMPARINCPVVAIHGDYDTHPAEGVREPLSRVLKEFKFILLEKCGHYPWRERLARDRFFELLKTEVQPCR